MNDQRHPFSRPARAALLLGALLLSAGLAACGAARAGDSDIPIRMPDPPPTVVVGAAPAQPALSGAPLFSATFDDEAALASLELVDFELPAAARSQGKGRWGVYDGTLEQRDTVARQPSTHPVAALAGDGSWADMQVSVSFYDVGGATAGLVARRNGDNYYRYMIIAERLVDRPKQVLERVIDGVPTRLVEIAAPGYESQRWHTLSMSLRGGAITVLLDGQVVIEDVDPTPLPAGQAGIYTRAIGGMRFDNLLVETLAP